MIDEDICLPLFERLRVLEEDQSRTKLKCDKFMVNIKQENNSLINILDNEEYPENHPLRGRISPFSKNAQCELSPLNFQKLNNSSALNSERVNVSLSSTEFSSENACEIYEGSCKMKRPFLKKGQGLSRFGMKSKLKGFKKKGVIEKKLPFGGNKISGKNELPIIIEEKCDKRREGRSNFEELEKLVEHDSFCSTSTRVQNLLNEETLLALSPTPSKPPSTSTKQGDLPLIFKGTLQVRSAVQVHDNDKLVYEDKRFLGISGDISSSGNTPSGILKNLSPIRSTPVSHNVKFRERGVEVIEFESPNNFSLQSLMSDAHDSDLVSMSDLEHLALMHCKDKVYRNILNYAKEEEERSDVHEMGNNSESQRICHYTPTLRPRLHNSPANNKKSSQPDHFLQVSQIADINNEIHLYKRLSEKQETIINEMKDERKELICNQNLLSYSPPKGSGDDPEEFREKIKANLASKRLRSLNIQLKKLESENAFLRSKMTDLENKEIRNRNQWKTLSTKLNKLENISKFDKCTESHANGMIKNTKNRKMKVDSSNIGVENKFDTTNARKKLPKTRFDSKKSNVCDIPTKSFKQKTKNQDIINFDDNTDERSLPNLKSDSPAVSNFRKSVQNPENENLKTKALFSGQLLTNDDVVKRLPVSYQFNPIGLNVPTTSSSDLAGENCNPENSLSKKEPRHVASSAVGNTRLNYILPYKIVNDRVDDNSLDIIDIPCSQNQGDPFLRDICSYPTISGVHTPHEVLGSKQVDTSEKVIYYYAQENIVKTIYKQDGRKEIVFPSGQKEIYFKDGSYQIFLKDGSSKSFYTDGSVVAVCENGAVVRTTSNGEKSVLFPNGQKEIHRKDSSVSRMYPNGTVKTLYPDGSSETRYPSGFVRLKDKKGNMVCSKTTNS